MIRSLTSLLLALILALTSQSMAVARGASAATGQMVLCTGSGPIAVYVDTRGQPTSAPHICPDAALNILVDVVMPDLDVPRHIVRFDPTLLIAEKPAPLFAWIAPPSRGPPLRF